MEESKDFEDVLGSYFVLECFRSVILRSGFCYQFSLHNAYWEEGILKHLFWGGNKLKREDRSSELKDSVPRTVSPTRLIIIGCQHPRSYSEWLPLSNYFHNLFHCSWQSLNVSAYLFVNRYLTIMRDHSDLRTSVNDFRTHFFNFIRNRCTNIIKEVDDQLIGAIVTHHRLRRSSKNLSISDALT